MKTQSYKLSGLVTGITKNAYNVTIKNVNDNMLCYLSGKMMKYKIKPVIGDTVEVEFDQSDTSKGRIVTRK